MDLARRALLALEPSAVGAHLGVSAEDESAATHRFEATLPGYRGWQWAVVVAAPPGADRATVSESALLPGPDALVAPDFVPWEQRIRPGDLAPGDLLAPAQDDPRLVPGYMASGDPEVDEVALEIGLGRAKVLSEEGRIEAAERWYSEHGPETDMAKAAPATCGTCGFYLPLAGALRAAFGVCGNAMGADGRVVHTEYGCGAHSDVVAPTGGGSPLYEAYDDAAFDVIPPEELGKSSGVVAETASVAESAAAVTHPEAIADATAAESAVAATVETEKGSESAGSVADEVVTSEQSSVGEAAAEEQPAADASATPEANAAESLTGTTSATEPNAAESVAGEVSSLEASPEAESAVDATPSVEPRAVNVEAGDVEPSVLVDAAADETPAAEPRAVNVEAGDVQASDAGDASATSESSAAEPVTGEVPSLSDDVDADAPANDTAAEPGSTPGAQADADDDGESRSESGSSPRN